MFPKITIKTEQKIQKFLLSGVMNLNAGLTHIFIDTSSLT